MSICRVAVIGSITYGDFRDNNVRGWAAEFSGAVCHDVGCLQVLCSLEQLLYSPRTWPRKVLISAAVSTAGTLIQTLIQTPLISRNTASTCIVNLVHAA